MRICILLMRTAFSEEDSERLFGLARCEPGTEVAIYLIGDGVLCARKGQKGYHSDAIEEALRNGAKMRACLRDLRARGIPTEELVKGIEPVEDLEGMLIEDVMENAGRVFSW
ncbi:MAG: DsrE family protein [Methanomassiliicoccales archaeon]|nr:DsrE family protein [Methanomassiliicoccales archaeon]